MVSLASSAAKTQQLLRANLTGPNRNKRGDIATSSSSKNQDDSPSSGARMTVVGSAVLLQKSRVGRKDNETVGLLSSSSSIVDDGSNSRSWLRFREDGLGCSKQLLVV